MSALTHATASAAFMGLGALPLILGVGGFADPQFPMAQAAVIAGAGFALAAATDQAMRIFQSRRSAMKVIKVEAAPVVSLALETMLRVVQADGRIDRDETRLVRDSITGLTDVTLSETEILHEAAALKGSTVAYLRGLGDRRYDLDDGSRDVIVKAAYLAMMADGTIADEEGWIVDRVYAALMPRRKLEEIIADLDPWLN